MIALVLLYYAVWLVQKNSRHLLDQWDAKLKRIVTCWLGFSRAWRGLPVFTLSFHWLLLKLSFVLIGCWDYFAFGFTKLSRNALYNKVNLGPLRLSLHWSAQSWISVDGALFSTDNGQCKIFYQSRGNNLEIQIMTFCSGSLSNIINDCEWRRKQGTSQACVSAKDDILYSGSKYNIWKKNQLSRFAEVSWQ